MKKLIIDFLQESKIYCDNIMISKIKTNKANAKSIKIYEKIKKANLVIELLKHLIETQENEGIRFCLAATIIKEYPIESLSVLNEIIKNKSQYSIDAEVISDLYKNGKL